MKLLCKSEYEGSRWGLTFSNDQQFLLHTQGIKAVARDLCDLTPAFSLATQWGNAANYVQCHPTQPLMVVTGCGYSNYENATYWNVIPIYNWQSRQLIEEIKLPVSAATQALFLNKDTLVFLGEEVDGIYSLKHGRIKSLPIGEESYDSLSIHPDGRTLMASGSSQGGVTVHIFDVYEHTTAFGEQLPREVEDSLDALTIGTPASQIRDAAFSPDGRYIIITHRHILIYSYPERQLLRFINRQGKTIDAFEGSFTVGADEHWSNPVFTHDSRQMYCGSPDGLICCWDFHSGELLSKRPVHNGQIFRLALSPDNKLLASSSADGTLKLWRLED